jgi:hypothetical protein
MTVVPVMMVMVVVMVSEMPRVGVHPVRRVPSGVGVCVVFRMMMRVVLRVMMGRMMMRSVVMGRMVALLMPPTSLVPTVPLGHGRVQEGSAADA